MRRRSRAGRLWYGGAAIALLAVLAVMPVGGCDNSPYEEAAAGQSVLYLATRAETKSLDPGGEDWSGLEFLAHIVEPPFQYKYLHPTELEGLTAAEVPKGERRKVTYKGKQIDAVVYRIRLKRGIMYHEHPCFVEANRRLSEDDVKGIHSVADFTSRSTRELVAADYIHTIRRLADPRTKCVVYATLAKCLLGMDDYRKMIEGKLEAERARRRKAVGEVRHNSEWDKKFNPVPIDYADGAEAFPFVSPVFEADGKTVDTYAFEVVLNAPYPQILYWMAMTFFGPVPRELVAFHSQPLLLARGVFLNTYPLGTGPYILKRFDPINEIVLERNPDYREEKYPELSRDHPDYERLDAAGLLEDCGERIPIIDRIVFRMEKEAIPRWSKFLQGYYDEAVVLPELFDQAVTLTSGGQTSLSDEMAARGVRIVAAPPSILLWYAFNMEDPVVGGYTEQRRKLRQAISIALDIEEAISVFANGQGVPAHGPVPPGTFGSEPGKAGMNPYVYDWDDRRNRPRRKSLDRARKLLAEAGYPKGIGPDGQRLTIRYLCGSAGVEDRSRNTFLVKQFKRLGIGLEIQATSPNVFHDKIKEGSFQFIRYGWAPDYPDPENYLFLFYTAPDSTDKDGKPLWGQNGGRYKNPDYERLFVRMRGMENSPERLRIIRQMLEIIRRDAPAIFRYHPLRYGLYHKWYRSVYPRVVTHNTIKYRRIKPAMRAEYRRKHNQPQIWPPALFALAVVLAAVPAVRAATKQLREV